MCPSGMSGAGPMAGGSLWVPVGLSTTRPWAFSFGIWPPRGQLCPLLGGEKGSQNSGRGWGGAQCLSGNSLHFWAQAAQVPLALSTVFEGGLGALQEDRACSCTPKVPPRAQRWPGLGNPWGWRGVYGKRAKPSGSPPFHKVLC